MGAITQEYGAYTAMTVTNLHGVTSSATVGWQSARVSNLVTKALDYEISVLIKAVNSAPANDKALYVYAVAWQYDDSSAWTTCDGGTTTIPGGSEAAYTIATPNNLKLLGVMNYTTQNQPMHGKFFLSNAFGGSMSDGWSLVIINFTGITLAADTNAVAYKSISYSVA